VELAFEHVARTDVGRVRRNNEDAIFASPRLVAVADGVGGHAAGEVASRIVIDALGAMDKCWLERPLSDALADAVTDGNERIAFLSECRPQLEGMGTTLTAVAIDGDTLTLANIGDSRTYLLRDGTLEQLTRDDSLVQDLIDSGSVSAEEALEHPQSSLVLKALDGRRGRTPALRTTAARPGDRLLLCSDGLSDAVGEDDLKAALADPSREACAGRLVELALLAGGHDNISVVVADVLERRDPATSWRR
jgi:protein phosphatase